MDDDVVPSTPDPAVETLVAALIRHILTILATLGVVHGTISDSTISIIAGAVVGIGMVVWSLYQKFAAKRADHTGSVISARAGVAVQPK
jgi:hypothetical protein